MKAVCPKCNYGYKLRNGKCSYCGAIWEGVEDTKEQIKHVESPIDFNLSLINCRACGKSISPETKSCPNCGAKIRYTIGGIIGYFILSFFIPLIAEITGIVGLKKRKINAGWVLTVGIFWDILHVFWLISFLQVVNQNTNANNNQGFGLYLRSGFEWKNEGYGSRYLVGEVYNPSAKQYSYAMIEFNLYDKSGAQVGTAFDNISNLEPHGVWKFKALVFDDRAENARFKGITGW